MLYLDVMATDPSTQTPVEIDTILAANYNDQARVWARIVSETKHLESLKRQLVKHDLTWIRKEIDKVAESIQALREQNSALIAESIPFLVEYDRRPWNRYFLVTNGNGHVHRGLDCHTCFRTTEYSWLVNLADCDEDAMIEEWGERACTVCFPSAPTNPNFNRPARVDREAREAREAEKAAKDAVKAEKAITDLDGSPLRVGGYVLKTKVAARNELSSAFQSLVYYGTDHSSDFVGQIRHLVAVLDAAEVDWKKVPGNAIKKALKDSVIPPNNPYRLTPEQIVAHEAEIKDNAATAQALAEEVIG
jgi:hypothetical protein